MQLAMTSVNEQNKEDDLPDLEMGIGIHTGQVVVGNIGSLERMKYGVVGSQVNLTSRIQSCTTGGQVLVSEATRREVGPMLKIGKHKLSLIQAKETLVVLAEEIPFSYFVAEGSQFNEEMIKGSFIKMSPKWAEVRLDTMEIRAKGFEQPVTVSEVIGIGGLHTGAPSLAIWSCCSPSRANGLMDHFIARWRARWRIPPSGSWFTSPPCH
jgi:hypothetical protein